MKKRFLATAATVALATGSGVATIALADQAHAAVTTCSASDAAIYTPPSTASIGAPGTLLACRTSSVPVLNQNANVVATKVQYASTDNVGKKIAVSGTVIVPKAPWTGGGTRPLIAFNPGTLGIGTQCALSKQIGGKFQDMYEGVNLDDMLKAGYAVAATDGVGYLNGQVHPYVIGANAAHAILDIARVASKVPGSGISATTKVGISGYSEGGHASLWAAQLAGSYAPQLNVVGAAAGGVPGNLTVVGNTLNGGPFAGFLADAAVGLAQAYPNLPFESLLNQAGRDAVAKAKTQCLLGTLSSFLGAKIESFTTKGYSINQLRGLVGTDGKTWGDVLDAQSLGVNIGKKGSGAKYQIGFPTFQYRGIAEEVIDTRAENATRDAYCKAGITTDWNQLYLGEHLTTDSAASLDVVTWMGDRFAGRITLGNCLTPSF